MSSVRSRPNVYSLQCCNNLAYSSRLGEFNRLPDLHCFLDRQRRRKRHPGPKGEKRPADAIGNAIMIAQIATGEIDETATTDEGKNTAAVTLGRIGGKLELPG